MQVYKVAVFDEERQVKRVAVELIAKPALKVALRAPRAVVAVRQLRVLQQKVVAPQLKRVQKDKVGVVAGYRKVQQNLERHPPHPPKFAPIEPFVARQQKRFCAAAQNVVTNVNENQVY